MLMSRRKFVASSVAASALLMPFLRSEAKAGTTPPKRLIVMTSLGTVHDLWSPTSAAGHPVTLSSALQPLSPILGDIVLVDGLSFANPSEGHSTPQTLTGKGFGNAYGGSTASVDQYISQKLGTSTKVPSIILGWQGVNEGQFFAQGARLPPIDSPVNAWQTLFSASTPPPTTSGVAMPRQSILDLAKADIKALQANLGSEAQARLSDHLDSIGQVEASISGTGSNLAGCTAPTSPNLNGANPEDQTSTQVVANAHASLIVAALACDVTRIVGMQWGISNGLYLEAPNVNNDEHSMVHSGVYGQPTVIAAEQYLSSWFVSLVQALKNTADPSAPGSSLLDNTLIMWTRDIGDGPTHTQFAMPYVLAGGGSYLKTSATGAFFSYGGNNATAVTGTPHQRLLLNLCDFMGVSNYSGFGAVSQLNAGDQQPLTDLKG